MAKMTSGMRMLAMARAQRRDDRGRYSDQGGAEMRRRRDSRGRYMEGGDGGRMEHDGGAQAYRPWPEPHIPPYLDGPGMTSERPSQMRDSNVVNIRDYQDRRRIGFGMTSDDVEDGGAQMRQYGRRYDPNRPPRMHYGSQTQGRQEMGRSEGSDHHLTRDEAEEWVRGMEAEDGRKGGRWMLQEIQQYAGNYGIHGEQQVIEFFAVLNALASDYGKVAQKFGVDKMDFWAEMAKAFIHDKDAVPGKVKTYFECIAKHDDD